MNSSGFSSIDELPDPLLRGEQSLEETLASRRSEREYNDEPLTDAHISQLLWAAQGVTDPAGSRAAPSAGALYPLDLYVARSSGLYHFEPAKHELTRRSEKDLRQAFHGAALGQEALIKAPAVFLITGTYARTRVKYGPRARRYVHMEAGHAAQNLLLQAVALDLGGVPIGAFNDDRLSEILGLPDYEAPLYLIPIGHPR
jgi:SagB-type dehydrogenase family enzyme